MEVLTGSGSSEDDEVAYESAGHQHTSIGLCIIAVVVEGYARACQGLKLRKMVM